MFFLIAALLLGPATDTRIVANVARVTAAASVVDVPKALEANSDPKALDAAAPAGPATASLATSAADSQSLGTLRLDSPQPKSISVIAAERIPPRKSWILLSLAQHGAAAFDAYSTRQAVSAGAHEDNPLLRPFADSPAIYVASQICPTALDFLARRMQESDHAFIRRSWWLPQSAGTALFIFSGVHNLNLRLK